MPTKIIGTAPYQVPRNADLGTLAVQDLDNVNIQGGSVTLGASSTQGYFQNTDVSDIKPSLLLDFANSKSLDSRIIFTRASTAMCYDGKTTTKYEENLLPYSQTLSSWGSTQSCTAIDNIAVAPDGTLTASKLIEGTSNAAKYIGQSCNCTSGYVYTLSAYAKAESRNYFGLVIAGKIAHFDVSGGTVVSTESGLTSSIQSVGNGWYRCSIQWAATGAGTAVGLWLSQVAVTSPGATNIYAGDGVSGVYVWGPQLEQRSTAGTYVKTTSVPVSNHMAQLVSVSSGQPRFDHDPITGESYGLLIEEQRTNLIAYSSDFTNAAWTKTGTTVIANTTTAPDGTVTADTLSPTSNTALAYVLSGSAGTFSLSVYAKAGTESNITLACTVGYQGVAATFNLINGTASAITTYASGSHASISGGVPHIIPVGGGWYRCILGQVNVDQSRAFHVGPGLSNGTNTGSVVVWGAQLESGSFATSYIPTSGASATRLPDYVELPSGSFSQWYNTSEGTIFADSRWSVDNSPNGAVFAFESTGTERMRLYQVPTYSEMLWQTKGGVFFVFNSASTSITRKTALAYRVGNFAITTNGANASTNTTSDKFVYPTYLAIGRSPTDGNALWWNGTIAKIAYYTKRLSNAELQEITL